MKSQVCEKILFLVIHNNSKLDNIAIANALQLEAARATPALSTFNYDPMPSLKSLNYMP